MGHCPSPDFMRLVRSDVDVKLLARVEGGGIGQPDFIEHIGGVRDQLLPEDFLVRVGQKTKKKN